LLKVQALAELSQAQVKKAERKLAALVELAAVNDVVAE
jgi:hypothetical protein